MTELKMICDPLKLVNDVSLLRGFSLVSHRPEFMQNWTRIQRAADQLNEISDDLFRIAFGTDDHVLHQRILYLKNAEEEIIGTSAAWFGDEPFDGSWGRVHWVAVLPEYQGQGLGKYLLSETIKRLIELGHQKAYLTTDSRRPHAIKLYQDFGFEIQTEGVEF